MKTCTQCKAEKENHDFPRNKKGLDGLDTWCKKCKAENNRERNREFPEKEKLKRRQYRLSSKAKYPEKRKARRKLYLAVKSGKLLRGDCSICGLPKAEAHHEDYSKPLDVIWLCRKHHKKLHNSTTD